MVFKVRIRWRQQARDWLPQLIGGRGGSRGGRSDGQAKGQGLDQTAVEKAVALSVEKYCGVHATLAPQVKITWAVEIMP